MSELRSILNDFFHGREQKVIRIRLTKEQMESIAKGDLVEFKAGDIRVEILRKSEPQ